MGGAFGQKGGTRRTSAALGALGRREAPGVTAGADAFPIVISGASGARVRDADGNRYIDMTSFFGACLAGHRNPAVTTAARRAIGHLVHGMGDVYPDETRAKLLELVCGLMPAGDYRGLLSLNGSDAVETALKFAAAATGRGGAVAFQGSYHGLSGNALEVTSRDTFRTPFESSMSGRAVFAPWPAQDGSDADRVLEIVYGMARAPVVNRWGVDIGRPGALIVEPIQGRGGMRVPPPGFLRGLAGICRDNGIVFITDEIFSGTFRTGRFLAGDFDGVAPDAVCLGKALGGGFPLSAAMMRPWLADAVARDRGEAVHTSTFMGWPVACAAATANIRQLRRLDPAAGAARIERAVRAAAEGWTRRFPAVAGVRGRGAMLGLEFAGPARGETVIAVVRESLRLGLLVLPEGPEPCVISLTPPLSIGADLDGALTILEKALEKVCG